MEYRLIFWRTNTGPHATERAVLERFSAVASTTQVTIHCADAGDSAIAGCEATITGDAGLVRKILEALAAASKTQPAPLEQEPAPDLNRYARALKSGVDTIVDSLRAES